MKKKILALATVFIGIGIYYTGVYTYFIENKVNEELPEMNQENRQQILIEPKILKQGDFIDADFFHKGKGRAIILGYPDGKKILRFENFEIINGPDLYIYLSQTTAPTGDLGSLGNYIDLGRLKGNIGDQNYELTEDINDFKSVVIWCKKFGVLFPYAVLK